MLKNLKPLLSIAKQRATLPIFNHILIQDGRAYATDMNMTISVACDLPNGLYDAKMLEACLKTNSPLVKAELDASDFPMMVMGDISQSVSVNLKTLAHVWKAASLEETRYYLNGVMFEKSGRMVATDGHRLITDLRLDDSGEQDFILPNAAIKSLLACAGKKDQSFDLAKTSTGKILLSVNGYQILTKTIDGTFPEWRRVIPKTDSVIELDCETIKKECETAIIMAKANGEKTAIFKIYLSNGLHIGFNAKYVLDFIKDETGTFELHYDALSKLDSQNHLRVPTIFKTSWPGTQVLMPMLV